MTATSGFCFHRVAALAAATVLTLATISCSGSDAASGSGALDACTLIDPVQAGKVLDTTIRVKPVDTSAAGPGAASMCNYQAAQMGDSFMVIAGHIRYSDAARQMAERKREILDGYPSDMAKPLLVDVPGLGDAAVLARSPGYFQLHVLANGKVLVINRNHAADDVAVKQVEELARLALMKF